MFRTLLPVLATLLAVPAPEATEEIDAAYPEAPLIAGRTVLFAEMHEDRITAWEDGKTRTFYKTRGCGPTAIAPYGPGYVVLCHLSDEIHVISAKGERRKRLRRTRRGHRLSNPNDASADGRGGVWFTASGRFSRDAPRAGQLLYLDADGKISAVEGGLAYANGVHFDRTMRQIFVTEHLGGRIRIFRERKPGSLMGSPITFTTFDRISAVPGGTDLTGPDGLETDEKGNLYVALYGTGRLYIFRDDTSILFRLDGLEPLITNVAVDGCELIVTGARRTARKPYPGSVRRIPNPVCGGE